MAAEGVLSPAPAVHVSPPPPATAVSRPWAASGVASLLSCPSVRVHAHGQLPRAPTTAWIVCAAATANNSKMFPTHCMGALIVVLLVAVTSTASAFQNEGERMMSEGGWAGWLEAG